MKKVFVLIVFILTSSVAIAQKIKVKDGIVSIDKNDVVKVEVIDEENDIYKFRHLNSDEELFTVDYNQRSATINGEYISEEWLELTRPGVDYVNSVSDDITTLIFDNKKLIANVLTKKLLFFDAEGVNQNFIDDFFSEERIRKNKDTYDKIFDQLNNPQEVQSQVQEEETGLQPISRDEIVKVKYKRDQILLDKEPIFNVSEDENGWVIFTQMDGTELVRAKNNSNSINEVNYSWIDITTENSEKVNQMDMEYFTGIANNKRYIAEFLLNRLNFFDENGIYPDKVKSFMESDSSSPQYEKMLEAQLEYESDQEVLAQWNIKVDKEGKVYRNRGIEIGKVIGPKISEETQGNPIQVGDLDGKLIATAKVNDFTNEIIVFDNISKEEFSYKTSFELESDREGMFKSIVEQLVLRGHTLEHEAAEYMETKQAAREEAYEKAKEASSNLYGLDGYVVEKGGEKLEGKITMIWEAISNPNDLGDFKNVVSLDGNDAGKIVTVLYTNHKGKQRSKSFKSKSGTTFYIKNKDGSETKYKGLKVKQDGFTSVANATSLSFDSSSFYEIIEENDRVILFRDSVTKDKGILIPSQKKGYIFETSNKARNFQNIKEYIGKDIPEEYALLDYTKPSEIKKLIDYISSGN